MTIPKGKKRPSKFKWAPYALILPSLIYLALFFAWPMVQGLLLAIRDENTQLELHPEARRGILTAGILPRGARVTILDRQANLIPPEDMGQRNLITENWFLVRGADTGDQPVEGWTPERRIRVTGTDEDGNPTAGSVRIVIGAEADPLTRVHAEADEESEVTGSLEVRAPVEILDQATLEIWFLVQGEHNGQTVEGWAQSRYIQVFSDATSGRVDQGDTGQFTTRHIQRMTNDRFFIPALRDTLLLMVAIIPLQFVLAIIMGLVIQANLKGGSFFLYIFAIALGVSDLAVGIVWYSVFTQFGYLNSILQGVGLINAPITYLSARSREWILFAIWMAEIWRATSIVMVIVVAGLQAISHEVLEAAEVFGASLWQRIRFIILPLLAPSLQVALILRTILAFQVFAVVIVLSGGDIVTVLANETYRQYYTLRNFNVAAAYASFILLLSMLTSYIYIRVVRTQEEVSR